MIITGANVLRYQVPVSIVLAFWYPTYMSLACIDALCCNYEVPGLEGAANNSF